MRNAGKRGNGTSLLHYLHSASSGAGRDKMSNENISILVWCWYDLPSDAIQMRIVRVETGEDVRVKDGNFLLRFSIDEVTSIMRCSIRHIASGREAYMQGGPNLRSFVQACLLGDGASGPAAPGTPEE